ncbi:MAG TPA: DinB family protein [Dehalococcoidia bacterium]
MSWVEHVRGAYAYNEWANQRLLDAAAKLSDEQLTSERGGSRGSVADNLSHLVNTQVGWADTINETEFTAQEPLPKTEIMTALRRRFAESHTQLREIADGLTDESLAAVVRRERGGRIHGFPRWQMLLHLANHGTQHRAEIGLALLALDASPGDLDAIYFFPDLGAEG